MAIQGFFTGDVKIRDLNGVLKAVDGIVEVATDAGTVTSVGIQVGSTGTDVNVANSPVTTSGNITLNLPTASATNRGLLSSADWAIFDAKQGSITLTTTGNNGSATLTSGTLNIPTYTLAGLGGISLTSLSASSPLAYNNTTGAFSIQVANGSQNGYLSSSDWTTFNSKQSALTFSSPLVNTSGTISIPAATSSVNGYLTSTDWATFNNKQGAITLTTTGSSGAATLIGTTLNIPNYSGALTGYVPYTGATGNVDLGEYGISSGYFQADLTPSGTLQVGRMQWNSTDGTMDLRLMGNNVTLQIGQEQVARVVNGTGVNLLEANYQAVKIIGAQGQRLQVGLARADNDANSKDTLGLVTENINNNQEGFITISGLVNEINTTGSLQGETWADGDTLYLSGTTSGAITNVKPTAPIHTVIVGFVVYAHANHGKIFVKVDNGYELEELHDVAPTPYVNKGVLYRDTATNLWKSATIGTLLGYTPANAATTLTINGTAYDLSANRTWNVGTVTSIGTSGPLTGGTITGSGTIGITQATTSTDGYLSSTDWNTFNNKQAAGSYITALTGEATATGPGSASVTLSTSAVTGKLLTGLNLTGGGTIADTDSILQAFGKVQNQISGLAGGVTYQGVWNASTNTPTLTSSVGTKGYYYIVDVAGSTNLNGITDWKIGDWAIFNGSIWDKVDNTDAVSSVNGFTGAVSLTTSNIAEGTNLYYLDSRARLALSFTAGSGAYDNTTGVITIPTNTSQLTNGANFITLSSLSASSPLSYNSGTGAFSIQVANGSQNGYLSSSDWTTFNSKQNAITLTTTGSSGSSTLVGATLNVPTYTLSGLGGVPTTRQLTINGTAYDLSADRSWSVGTHTGSLTSGYIPKATGTTSLTDSLVYDTGTAVLIGTTTASTSKFMVYSTTADNHYQAIGSAPSFRFADTITSPTYTGIVGLATASNHFIIGAAAGDMVLANNTTSSIGNFIFGTGTTERMRITPTGNVSINNTNNTYRFDVNGTVRFTGQLRLESTITDGTYTYTLPSATGTLALTSAIPANPVGGTGTTNYLPKFTGASTIGNSIVQDDATTVTIGGQLYVNRNDSNVIKVARNGGSDLNTVIEFANASTSAHIGSNGTLFGLGGTTGSIAAQPFIIVPSSSEKMRLDASGNLGLGVTPSAGLATANYRLFEIGLDGGGSIYSGSNQTLYGTNISWVGGTPNYVRTGSAPTLYNQSNGAHSWSTAPTGTAGNAISFTQAMTLNASGNVSIGNTNDTYKLDVSGASRILASTYTAGSILYLRDAAATGSNTTFAGLFLGSSPGTDFVLGKQSTNTVGSFAIKTGGGTTLMTLSDSGAATFSSSVRAGTHFQLSGRTTSYGYQFPDWQIYNTTGGGLAFNNYSSDLLTIASSGSVGIGTTSPSNILTIKNNSGGTNGIDFQNYASSAALGQIIYNQADDTFNIVNTSAYAAGGIVLKTNSTERMRITSGGDVGIGTTSPTREMVLYRSSGEVHFKLANGTTGEGQGDGFDMAIDSSGAAYFIQRESQPINFFTSATERMRITSGGLVGIGTTSPSYRLVVNSGIDGISAGISGSTYGIRFDNGGTFSSGMSTIHGVDATLTGSYQPIMINGSDVRFGTSATERMRITSAGSVGIGTTTPSIYGLSFANQFTVSSTTTYANISVAGSSGNSGGIDFGNQTVRHAGVYGLNGSDLGFYTNGSNSGNGLNERMRITSGGAVGIGVSSMWNNEILSVQRSSNGTLSTVPALLRLTNQGSGRVAKLLMTDSAIIDGIISMVPINSTDSYFSFGFAGYTESGLVVRADGRVGIGTTSPATDSALTVIGNLSLGNRNVLNTSRYIGLDGSWGANAAQVGFHVDASYNSYLTFNTLLSGVSGGERMRITSSGDVLVNATSTTQGAKFYVNGLGAFGSVYVGSLGTGTVYSNGGTLTNTNPSDRRLKTNIIPLTYGLSDILKLNPVSYNWKDGTNGKQFGFIAQEVQEIMPDAVKPGEYLGLEKDAIYSALINAIKELKEELDLIKNK